MSVMLLALLRESAWLSALLLKQPMANHTFTMCGHPPDTPSNVLCLLSTTYIPLHVLAPVDTIPETQYMKHSLHTCLIFDSSGL